MPVYPVPRVGRAMKERVDRGFSGASGVRGMFDGRHGGVRVRLRAVGPGRDWRAGGVGTRAGVADQAGGFGLRGDGGGVVAHERVADGGAGHVVEPGPVVVAGVDLQAGARATASVWVCVWEKRISAPPSVVLRA